MSRVPRPCLIQAFVYASLWFALIESRGLRTFNSICRFEISMKTKGQISRWSYGTSRTRIVKSLWEIAIKTAILFLRVERTYKKLIIEIFAFYKTYCRSIMVKRRKWNCIVVILSIINDEKIIKRVFFKMMLLIPASSKRCTFYIFNYNVYSMKRLIPKFPDNFLGLMYKFWILIFCVF